MDPKVSILIPAYNAEKWIKQTLESAVNQTYPNVEIVVVNDGSRDNTLKLLKEFRAPNLRIIDQPNAGGAAARNTALAQARGDYLQWLDHDDVLAPEKVAEQVKEVKRVQDDRYLFAGAFSTFYFCLNRSRVASSPLSKDLGRLDYFYLKFERDLWMHTTCWLVSRELTEKAGPWFDLRSPDDDGEYFCRVVAASTGIIYVPTAHSYWRIGNTSSFSYSRQNSTKALAALLESTRRCIGHFRALDDSERTRKACVTFLRNRLIYYYPHHPEMLSEIYTLAEELGGSLSTPPLRRYEAIRPLVGWRLAKWVRDSIRGVKQNALRSFDKLIYDLNPTSAKLASARN
jgi:glycosyltransferase involved in cell wall biosynthesis